MKTLKVMGIIGIIWFTLCFVAIVALLGSHDYGDHEAAAGMGVWAVLYGIPFAIVVVVKSKKKIGKGEAMKKLGQLQALKDQGSLTDQEFTRLKKKFLEKVGLE